MKSPKLLWGLLLCGPWGAVLACENPALTDIPEGVSGRAQRAVQDDMRRYLSEMSDYVACIQAEHAAAQSEDAPPWLLSLLVVRNNAAVAEIDAMRQVYVARIGPIEELAGPSGADVPEGAVDCVRASQDALTYEIADGENIILYANDGIYRNALDGCPELQQNTELSFLGMRARTPRLLTGLCMGTFLTIDGISVKCRLGPFYPLSESEAEELLRRD